MTYSLSRNFHPKLKVEISSDKLKALIDAIIELSEKGEIRQGIENNIQVYSIFDTIETAIGKKGQREVWKRVANRYPEVVTDLLQLQFTGKGQRKTPAIDLVGLIEILYVGRLLENFLDKQTSDKYYPKTEFQIVSVLKEAFYDCEPCTQFFVQGYRLDLYLASPRIAIECDEYNHIDYDKVNEAKRERLIRQALGCSFIRFNPYNEDFNLGKIIYQVRQLIFKFAFVTTERN